MTFYEGTPTVSRCRFPAIGEYPALVLEAVQFQKPHRTVVNVIQKGTEQWSQRLLGSATFTAGLNSVSAWPDSRLAAHLGDIDLNEIAASTPSEMCAMIAKQWGAAMGMRRHEIHRLLIGGIVDDSGC